MNNIFLEELINNNKIIYNILNCSCCLGTITRCKTLIENFDNKNNIYVSSANKISDNKKDYFPYDVMTNKRQFEKCIINNKINIIIHDLKVNQDLYNLGLKYKNRYNIKQYFMLLHNNYNIQNFTDVKNIIIPYDIKIKNEINLGNIAQNKKNILNYNIIYTGMIHKQLKEDKLSYKLSYIYNKYNIRKLQDKDKPILVATYGTGSHILTEQFFNYVYENYKNNYNLIFIYGLMYAGKKNEDDAIITNTHEPYLYELLYYADTIACHGAYNTMAESLSLENKKIIIIPKPDDLALKYILLLEKYYNNIKVVDLFETCKNKN